MEESSVSLLLQEDAATQNDETLPFASSDVQDSEPSVLVDVQLSEVTPGGGGVDSANHDIDTAARKPLASPLREEAAHAADLDGGVREGLESPPSPVGNGFEGAGDVVADNISENAGNSSLNEELAESACSAQTEDAASPTPDASLPHAVRSDLLRVAELEERVFNAHCRRLADFYAMFAPEESSNVREQVHTWSGREEELFTSLKEKYKDRIAAAAARVARESQDQNAAHESSPPNGGSGGASQGRRKRRGRKARANTEDLLAEADSHFQNLKSMTKRESDRETKLFFLQKKVISQRDRIEELRQLYKKKHQALKSAKKQQAHAEFQWQQQLKQKDARLYDLEMATREKQSLIDNLQILLSARDQAEGDTALALATRQIQEKLHEHEQLQQQRLLERQTNVSSGSRRPQVPQVSQFVQTDVSIRPCEVLEESEEHRRQRKQREHRMRAQEREAHLKKRQQAAAEAQARESLREKELMMQRQRQQRQQQRHLGNPFDEDRGSIRSPGNPFADDESDGENGNPFGGAGNPFDSEATEPKVANSPRGLVPPPPAEEECGDSHVTSGEPAQADRPTSEAVSVIVNDTTGPRFVQRSPAASGSGSPGRSSLITSFNSNDCDAAESPHFRLRLSQYVRKMLDFELAGLDLGLSIATRMAILRCAEKFYFELLLGVMARHEAAERQLMGEEDRLSRAYELDHLVAEVLQLEAMQHQKLAEQRQRHAAQERLLRQQREEDEAHVRDEVQKEAERKRMLREGIVNPRDGSDTGAATTAASDDGDGDEGVPEVTAWVNQGEHLAVQKPAASGDLLWWQFSTKEHDIAFGLQFKKHRDFISLRKGKRSGGGGGGATADDSDALVELVPQQRIKSQRGTLFGIMRAPADGMFVLRFDNSYSRMRRKCLTYRCEV
eukprot:INCI1072.3.p1 GENE.INCI1072.3~~INCI1072.3.p1  ORF type:complete len:903 (-),score=207.96 INCI1072.3:471-3179(-)